MGTRFRKSVSLGKSAKINVGKKSAGVSLGGKYGGVSINSKTGTRYRASVPGTGISYTAGGKIGGHGCLWWLFIGWWWWIYKIFLIYPCVWIYRGIKKLVTKAPAAQSDVSPNVAAAPDALGTTPTPAPSHEAEIVAFNVELAAIPQVEVTPGEATCKWRNPDTMPGVHLTNITRQTNMEKFFPVVVLDTETTGIGAGKHRIVELSAIKLGPDFVPESCFTTLINPGRQIPPSAEAVHHISTEMVANAPTFPEIAESFANYIAGCRIVGHNVKFDLEFLYAAGLDLPQKAIVHDTMDLAKKVLTSPGRRVYDKETGEMVEPDDYDVEDYKLTTLCDYYGIYRDDAHRSLSDCLATAKVLEHLIEDKLA